ncbi:hypothetical protein ACFY8P_07025 [Streptomyces sp. NPDC012693]|jgi:hypothetical protein|uniref:hypothetical protein n=1 Tax=unclassified Streptomyces TaxID=2593676 RepID=UPI0020306A33|nr:hypothetical protein [Streptomyces sp. MSC1_001]
MESHGPSARRRVLIEAVVVLAATAQDQADWLDTHEVAPDEIALGFDDAFRLAGRLAEDGQLSDGVLPLLRMIDEVFGEITQDSGVGRWTRAALFTDPGWGRARQLAREVLTAEGEETSPLPGIQIIR